MPKSDYPNLSKPPIQVVVFQIGYDKFPSFPQIPNSFDSFINEWFPIKTHTTNTNINLDNTPTGETKINVSKAEINVIMYTSKDNLKVVSITKNFLSLTISKTYSNWVEYMALLQKIWNAFCSKVLDSNSIITRASARFINRIIINNMETPSDYFNTTIYASENVIPGVVNTFLMKYTAIVEGNVQLHVTQGFEPQIGNSFPYIFDIDAICEYQINSESLWIEFDKLREVKNQTFFGNLTEKTLNLLL